MLDMGEVAHAAYYAGDRWKWEFIMPWSDLSGEAKADWRRAAAAVVKAQQEEQKDG